MATFIYLFAIMPSRPVRLSLLRKTNICCPNGIAGCSFAMLEAPSLIRIPAEDWNDPVEGA